MTASRETGTGDAKVCDLHAHSFHSDGELCPAELAQRARLRGYAYLGLTDHADHSNLEALVKAAVAAAGPLSSAYTGFTVIPGIELTHVPPNQIPRLIRAARELGARAVVVHGESPVEPVEPGTNRAAIEGGCDVLAHPGFLSVEEAELAAANGVFLELSARGGHSLTNGHVAAVAIKTGARLMVNSDAHAPGDLLTAEFQRKIALGAGLDDARYEALLRDAFGLALRLSGEA
ncbi:MAG: histidinol phosphate phosphatase domain-containing protein [Deltaproteobacteria bacterium]|jgi:histidinol phosphatase-like PHP family hydrolase|nr:histidinol phosphate phosphatase domain-containing protein [Deltaproteobacteria bacterium]